MESPTVLSSLHTLLRAHTSRPAALAYLHPYAPNSQLSSSSSRAVKGKLKDVGAMNSLEDQINLVKALRDVVDSARPLLAGEHRIRLVRALREITTHQSILMPLATTIYGLNTFHSSSSYHLVYLSPVQLLMTISKQLGIQTYLEDSQFGLLKTSLTLAGTRFVIDIDLEMDAAEDDEADDRGMASPAVPAGDGVKSHGVLPVIGGTGGERNQTRLSKLTANHVAAGSSTGKSDWIASVLKGDVEACLQQTQDEQGKVEAISHLANEMEEIKLLDALESSSYYSDLEILANGIQERIKSGTLHPSTRNTIFPSFRLLPNAGPTLRLRPGTSGRRDNLPSPEDKLQVEEKQTVASNWEVEIVGCMAVRSSVFGGIASAESAIRVESLIYEAPFPYLADFVHSQGTQHWSMAQPGPDGFVFGRISFFTWESFDQAMGLLRQQAVMNLIFSRIFTRDALVLEQEDDEKEDRNREGDKSDVDIEADGPDEIPLSVTLGDKEISVYFPLLQSGETNPIDVILRVSPKTSAPYVDLICDGLELDQAFEAAKVEIEKTMDLAKAVTKFVSISQG